MAGFFSPDVWMQEKEPLPLVAHCGACGLHKTCNTPWMKVSGEGKRKILIVAEAPGQNEDDKGQALVGAAGLELAQILWGVSVNMRKDCWMTNALICRPPNNRKPKNEEVDYCRPFLTDTIKQLKPNVIIALGRFSVQSLIPIAWKSGEVSDIGRWVGWDIPSQELNAWICPTYHPSFLLRQKGKSDELSYSAAARLHITRHLRQAVSHKDKPWPDGPPNYKERVAIELDPARVRKAIQPWIEHKLPVAVDLETTCLKPDSKYAEVLCCSVSDGRISVAFPWVRENTETVKNLVTSGTPIVAANLRFEERWFRRMLGVSCKNWHWDTVIASHWLDCRSNIASLKFQAFVRLGMPDYDCAIKPFMQTKDDGGNSPNRLKEVSPQSLMTYCGLDSLLEILVARKQGMR
jgi:uracil-DNA glycosylase family 4